MLNDEGFNGSFEEAFGNYPTVVPYCMDLTTGTCCNPATAAHFRTAGSLLTSGVYILKMSGKGEQAYGRLLVR